MKLESRSELLSIIIPTRNDGTSPQRMLDELDIIIKQQKLSVQVIVVDDSDTPSPFRVEEAFGFRLEVYHRTSGKGFGSAIRYGISKATGEYVMIMMGDHSDDPLDLPRLVDRLVDGFDLVIGSRFVSGGRVTGYPAGKLLANRLFNYSSRVLFRAGVSDVSTSFKIIRKSLLHQLKIQSNGFEISPEVTLRCIRRGARTCEVPVSWTQRKEGSSRFNLRRQWVSYLRVLLSAGLT